MGTISDLLSLAGAKSKSDALEAQAPIQPSDDPSAYGDKPASPADVGARIGGENEALRNLLLDTTHHLGAVDDLKESFSKLVDPLNTILTAVQQERAESARVRGALAAISSSHETLRGDFQRLERRSSDLESENARRRQELETALSQARELEANRSKLSREIAGNRAAMPNIEKQLSEETGQVRALTEERKNLTDRLETSDKRVGALEAEVARVLESHSLLGSARDALQISLERSLAESSRTVRQLVETETALSDARGKLEQTVGTLATADAERNKLATACEEANERRQTEVYGLNLKLDALRSHSDAAEKLLATARQSLVARSEEIRMAEVKVLEADIVRSKAEKNAEHKAAVVEGWQQQVKKLEQSNAELAERCRVMIEALTTSENWIIQSKETINSLTGQVQQLQADAAASRAKFEEDFVQINATVEHERCERALTEGALATVRGDYARLQGQMAQERSLRRGSNPRRSVSKDTR
jgi:chromosome segregation ATPase